jgi:hypothetical protein
MPTVIVENVPAEVYERLQQRATAAQRSLPEEMLHLVSEALRENAPAPRVPDLIPVEEIAAPFDLPRSSQPVAVTIHYGRPRLPDPIPE